MQDQGAENSNCFIYITDVVYMIIKHEIIISDGASEK